MVEFIVAPGSYEDMPKFAECLNREGINFKTVGVPQLTISVEINHVERFLHLVTNSKIRLEQI